MDQALDNIPCGFLTFTDDGFVRAANRQLSAWLGLSQDEIVGHHIDRIFSPGARIYYQTYFFPVLRLQGYQNEVYLTLRSRTGKDVPVLINAQRQERDGKMVNDCILMTMFQRNQFEDEIIKARNELDQEKQLLRAILHNIQVGVVVCDANGNLMLFNQAANEYLGLSQSSDSSIGSGDYQLYDASDGTLLQQDSYPLYRALSGETVKDEEYVLVTQEGFARTLLISGTAFQNNRGKKLGAVVAFKDISERKKLEESLKRTNSELEEYAYASSHDLQEPLRKVALYAQLLVSECHSDTPEAAEYANFIRSGVDRMQLVIRDLLSYSRTIHQTHDSAEHRANLNNALQEALMILDHQVLQSGASISYEELPAVQADEHQMSAVFQNLIANALKYRHHNQAPVIHISVKPEPECWVISIQDNGIGFAPEHAERIFGLFKRLYKDEFPGTGLGLAICRRIIERFHGKIWATSEGEGRGACFHFSLPKAVQVGE